jgi:hypothetical protein
VFLDDDYIYVMGWTEAQGVSPHGFNVYSRETKELVLTVPSMPHEQTAFNSFLLELECLEDRSRPARWGKIPEEVTFTAATKNKRGVGFPECPCCTCDSYTQEMIIVGDDMVFTQACDLFVWKNYRSTLKRIFRSKVTCPIQRGRWFAKLGFCIQAPTQELPYQHWCLRSWAATEHHLVCAFERNLISIDMRTLPSRLHAKRPDTISTTILFNRQLSWDAHLAINTSQVIVFESYRTSYLTFGFNERW